MAQHFILGNNPMAFHMKYSINEVHVPANFQTRTRDLIPIRDLLFLTFCTRSSYLKIDGILVKTQRRVNIHSVPFVRLTETFVDIYKYIAGNRILQ